MSHIENANLDPFSRAIDRLNPVRRISYDRDGVELVIAPATRGMKIPQHILDKVMADGAKSDMFTKRGPEWMRAAQEPRP